MANTLGSAGEEVKKYRKKSNVVIEASRWYLLGDHPKVTTLPSNHPAWNAPIQAAGCGWVETLEGGHIVHIGDWIIRGIKGEYYPCNPDIFALTYELASEPAPPPSAPMDSEICQNCHQAVPVWFAPNAVWNRVIPDRVGVFCPNCFINRAERADVICTGWQLVPENYQDGLQQEAPHRAAASPPRESPDAESARGTQSQSPTPEREKDSRQILVAQVSSGDDYANRRETSLLGTKGGGSVDIPPPSNGVTQEESSDRGNARTVSQPDPLESNSVAPSSARPAEPQCPICGHAFHVGTCQKPEGTVCHCFTSIQYEMDVEGSLKLPKPAAPKSSSLGEEMTEKESQSCVGTLRGAGSAESAQSATVTGGVANAVTESKRSASAPDAGQPYEPMRCEIHGTTLITCRERALMGCRVAAPSAPASAARELAHAICQMFDTQTWELRFTQLEGEIEELLDTHIGEQTRQLRSDVQREKNAAVHLGQAVNGLLQRAETAEQESRELLQRAQAAEAERDEAWILLRLAADELHEMNLANRTGNKPRNPEMTIAVEAKIREALPTLERLRKEAK